MLRYWPWLCLSSVNSSSIVQKDLQSVENAWAVKGHREDEWLVSQELIPEAWSLIANRFTSQVPLLVAATFWPLSGRGQKQVRRNGLPAISYTFWQLVSAMGHAVPVFVSMLSVILFLARQTLWSQDPLSHSERTIGRNWHSHSEKANCQIKLSTHRSPHDAETFKLMMLILAPIPPIDCPVPHRQIQNKAFNCLRMAKNEVGCREDELCPGHHRYWHSHHRWDPQKVLSHESSKYH